MSAAPSTAAGGAVQPWRSLLWLSLRECLRVSKLWTQTMLAPVVSSILFILVFGLSLGGRISGVGEVPELVVKRPSLEDIYLRMIGEAQ